VNEAEEKSLRFGTSGPFICEQCGKTSTTQQNLKIHIDRVHKKLKPFVCNWDLENGQICNKAFASQCDLQRDIDLNHKKETPYKCIECGKIFSTQRNLDIHINRIHQKSKPFVCNWDLGNGQICNKAFAIQYDLQEHIDRVHQKLRPYICEKCGKAFFKDKELRQHINTIHLEKYPYICKECGEAFSKKSLLDLHVNRIHLKLKPFSCDNCGKAFARKNELEIHINAVHQGTRPYICKECGWAFGTFANLSQHIARVHRKERPYICSKCGKAFTTSNDRNRHEGLCIPDSEAQLKKKYHIKKGSNVESTIAGIFEDNFGPICSRNKTLNDPTLGTGKIDIYCEGLGGKRVAIDVTASKDKYSIARKWTERKYQEYPDVDELWVILVSPGWDEKSVNDLNNEIRKDTRFQNVYIYHWSDLRYLKDLKIPPKIWKLLETYEQCTFQNVDQCKARWEEIKGDFD